MSKLFGFRSVVGRITTAYLLIVPVLGYALGTATYDAIKSYRNTLVIDRRNAAANQLIAGVYEVLLERVAANAALQIEQPAPAEMQDDLRLHRTAAMQKIVAAMGDLETQQFANKAEILSDLKGAIENANRYRANADSALKLVKAERDTETVKNLYGVLSALAASAQKAWSGVLATTSADDPELARLTNLRIFAWNLRDIAGMERSAVAQAIAAKSAIPPEKLAAIGEIRAQIALMWRLLQINLKDQDHPAVLKGMQSARDGYFGKFQPLADDMRRMSAGDANYPMSAQQWVDTTTPQLFTLLDVMYGAGEASEAHTANAQSAALARLGLCTGLLLLGILIVAGSTWFAYQAVARPIGQLAETVGGLTDGTSDVNVPHGDRIDEIGHLARAMQTFRNKHIEMEALRAEQHAHSMRQAQRGEHLGRVAAAFEQRIGGIVGTVMSAAGQLEAAAGTLTKTADSAQQLSGMVAASSEDASTNVRSVANATEEMTRSVNAIAGRVQESSRIAGEAVNQAAQTNTRITALSEAAGRIGHVVKLITAIAEQTNLLALNATIEAARAGEAGRGFAIVAQEVKALAGQTAKATDDISMQIAGMQAATAEAVTAIAEIGGTIGRISDIAGTIAVAVEQQITTTRDIACNVQNASRGTTEVATNISEVSAAASETGWASSQVLSSARSLTREGGVLRQEVDQFLSMVRAV
jgi:methyl-accepting chemotaxis protein